MYFNQSALKSARDVTEQYRLLTFLFHPDKGGDIRTMQAINAEYDALKTRFKNGGGTGSYSAHSTSPGASQSADSSGGNTRDIGDISNVTQADLDWLIAGSYRSGMYVKNKRMLFYTTRRGVRKCAQVYVMSSGTRKWYTSTPTSERKSGLTDEEARHFEPELWKKRQERKERYRSENETGHGRAFEVGDVVGYAYGYDATFYEFHEVVRVSASGKTVWTRKLRTEKRNGAYYDNWQERPIRGSYAGTEKKHVVQWSYGKPHLTIDDHWAFLVSDCDEWVSCDNYH